MRYTRLLATYWRLAVALATALGALALLANTRAEPLDAGALGRVDALSAFFIFATLGGAALAGARRPTTLRSWRLPALLATLVAAYGTPSTLAIAGSYALAALLMLIPSNWRAPGRSARVSARILARAAPAALAPICVLLGYGVLALRGVSRYDDPGTVAALDSFVFWFVLLAPTIVLWDLGRGTWEADAHETQFPSLLPHVSSVERSLFTIAWLYPLARLYSLGPWNTGWSFAAVLFGGALAGWCGLSALARPQALMRQRCAPASFAALALAGVGLGTSASIAAACFTMLVAVVLVASAETQLDDDYREAMRPGDEKTNRSPISLSPSLVVSFAGWLLTTAFPFAGPFVAVWMLMGAAVAGGVGLLAGLAWLVALALGLAAALWGPPNARRPLLPALSLALGIGAPLVVLWLILPVVQQMQGSLTPYGDVNIWPWIGLASADAAHTQVTTLPSIAVALLMLVLCALVYVVARLREAGRPAVEGSALDRASEQGTEEEILRELRAQVPWLALLLGAGRKRERRPGDTE